MWMIPDEPPFSVNQKYGHTVLSFITDMLWFANIISDNSSI